MSAAAAGPLAMAVEPLTLEARERPRASARPEKTRMRSVEVIRKSFG
jgi:hypothetical protein